MTNLLKVSGSGGAFKVSDMGFFRVGVYTATDKGGSTNVLVKDILSGTLYNPPNSSTVYPTSTKNTPIVFDGATYVYEVDGGDGNVADSTTANINSSKSSVEFTPKSGGTFFGNDGDIIRIAVNWRNWSNSKWQIMFADRSQYDATYVSNINNFCHLQLNGSVQGDATRLFFGYYDNSNSPQLHGSQVIMAADTKTAFNNSISGNPVFIDIERLNNAQLKVTLRDSNGVEFPGQNTLTCNTPSSNFTTLSDTNNDGIFVNDITYIYTDEVGSTGGPEVDYTIRKI